MCNNMEGTQRLLERERFVSQPKVSVRAKRLRIEDLRSPEKQPGQNKGHGWKAPKALGKSLALSEGDHGTLKRNGSPDRYSVIDYGRLLFTQGGPDGQVKMGLGMFWFW